MYGQVTESDTQRKKLIIVSAVMGIIILVLTVILINAIINKNKRLSLENSEGTVSTEEISGDNAEVSRAESANAAGATEASSAPTETSGSTAESGNLTPVSNEKDGILSAEASSEKSSSSETKALPSTGPREVLSLALLLGSVAMFISSKLYLKELA